MPEKNLQNVRREILSVIGGIQVKKDPATGFEMSLEIRDKKIPFLGTPPPRIFPAAVKRGGKCGDQIKLPAEVWQRFKCGDPVIPAIDSKELDQAVEDRDASDIETEAMMSESLGDEEKKSAAATDVQNF